MVCLYDLEAAKHLYMRMLEILHRKEDKLLTGWALSFLAYSMLEETEEAFAIANEGLSLFRELAHKPGIAQSLNIIGEIARFSGDDDRARRAYEECLTIAQQTGETRRIQLTFLNLSFLAQHEGDHVRAIHLARQGLKLACEMNNRLEIGRSLTTLAGSIGARGQPERGVRILSASEAAFGSMGAFHLPSDKREIDRIIATVNSQLNAEAANKARAEGRKMTLEQAVADALNENE